MMNNNFLKNRGYLLKKLQYEIFDALIEYMKANKLNQTKLAAKLNVSKGYISQIMNANFDHKLSKLVDLSIAIGKVPSIHLEDYNQYLSRQAFESLAVSNMQKDLQKDESAAKDESTAIDARVIQINAYTQMPYNNGRPSISVQA